MYCCIIDINLPFQIVHNSLMSSVWHRVLSQLIEERAKFAESKSAWSYLQTFLHLVLAVFLDFHFSNSCTPLWSDEPKGGNTVQEDSIQKLEIIAKSISEVEPEGLTCVDSGTTCTREKVSIKLHN